MSAQVFPSSKGGRRDDKATDLVVGMNIENGTQRSAEQLFYKTVVGLKTSAAIAFSRRRE